MLRLLRLWVAPGVLLGAALPSLTAAQNRWQGNWQGEVTFPDGRSAGWTLRLGTPAGDYLLFSAGSGLLLREVRRGDDLRFGIGGPDAVRCIARPAGENLRATCETRAGARFAEATLRPIPDGAPGGERPRAREAGVVVGVFPTGPLNAITDVGGVRVGHATVNQGDSVRTGVTAIIPAPGDLYARPVPGWIHTVNGYGKLIGETQVREFGELETPILLTCTLCVWSAARAMAWTLMEADSTGPHTINPVVGETNDSWVNDMWSDPVERRHVEAALRTASGGPVAEGAVGAGAGTTAFGWKGGIGTSSRRLPAALGGYTVGVLVQTNFGGNLTIAGAPVGLALDHYPWKEELRRQPGRNGPAPGDGGSLMIVLATDAPLDPSTLRRVAERAMLGAGRTGSSAHHSSGDYVIAFSTAESVRRTRSASGPVQVTTLPNVNLSPLFAATVEATEEAIYNALFKATTVVGNGRVLEPIPLAPVIRVLDRYGVRKGVPR